MAQTINTNLASLNAQRNLNKSQGALGTSLQRLSSGLRINSAKDDAAGLQISNKLTSQINGLNVAARNANDGISLAQTAEGAMQEGTNILQRMRELARQSANGTNSGEEREALNAGSIQLKSELDRISTTTRFGGKMLLDGNFTESVQVGARANETISVSVGDFRTTAMGTRAERAATAAVATATAKPTTMTLGTTTAGGSASTAVGTAAAALTSAPTGAVAGAASALTNAAAPTSLDISAANNNNVLTIGGGAISAGVSITLADNASYTASTLADEINTQIASSSLAGFVTASSDGTGITLTEVDQAGAFSGTALTVAGNGATNIFAANTASSGTATSAGTAQTLTVQLGAATAQTVTLAASYGDSNALASAIQGQLTGFTVAADAGGILTLTQTGTFGGEAITIGGTATGLFGTPTTGTAGTTTSNASFTLAVGAGAAQTISMASGTYTADALADEINRGIDANSTLKGNVRASVNEGKLEFKTTATGVAATLTFGENGTAVGLANLNIGTTPVTGVDAGPGTDSVESINISTAAGAQDAIAIIDAAINEIDQTRGDLGAIQNRFASTISNLDNIAENVAAARGRIQDADFAAETASLSKNQILQQAGISVLSQANSLPQQVLSLLQ